MVNELITSLGPYRASPTTLASPTLLEGSNMTHRDDIGMVLVDSQGRWLSMQDRSGNTIRGEEVREMQKEMQARGKDRQVDARQTCVARAANQRGLPGVGQPIAEKEEFPWVPVIPVEEDEVEGRDPGSGKPTPYMEPGSTPPLSIPKEVTKSPRKKGKDRHKKGRKRGGKQ